MNDGEQRQCGGGGNPHQPDGAENIVCIDVAGVVADPRLIHQLTEIGIRPAQLYTECAGDSRFGPAAVRAAVIGVIT